MNYNNKRESIKNTMNKKLNKIEKSYINKNIHHLIPHKKSLSLLMIK